jgi:hypothetical protein
MGLRVARSNTWSNQARNTVSLDNRQAHRCRSAESTVYRPVG